MTSIADIDDVFSKLDPASDNLAEKFGFGSYDQNSVWSADEPVFDHEAAMRDSKSEIARLSDEELLALEVYTGKEFMWINVVLNHFDDWANGDISTEELEDIVLVESRGYKSIAPQHHDLPALRRLVSVLDEALTKGENTPRVVYRGFSGEGDPLFNPDLTEWAASQRRVGTEIEFKGFSSASLSKQAAASFSGSGVVYEILTDKGMNVTATSVHAHEAEVLLPRDQHYVVVGASHVKGLFVDTDDDYPASEAGVVIQLVDVDLLG